MPWAIETLGLTKHYPEPTGWLGMLARERTTKLAVDEANLTVREGELFGLVGPNGAGKTTLIKMLCTLITPTLGTAYVNSYGLHQEKAIKASIGLVTSDERSFYWRLSGRQNLNFFSTLHNLPPEIIHSRVNEVLDMVGLHGVADKPFQTYSTGMRQRLSIARALLSRPKLLFLDEPTKGLDPLVVQSLHKLFREQFSNQLGITIFLTSHWLEEVEHLCDRIAIMHNGRIRACGTMAELRTELGLGEHYRITVSSLPASNYVGLQSLIAGLQVNAMDQGNTVLEFHAQQGSDALNQVLDEVRTVGGRILSFSHEAVSLEAIFSHLVGEEGNGESTTPIPTSMQKVESAKSKDLTRKEDIRDAPSSLPSVVRAGLRTSWAFLKRDAREEASYRFSFFLQFFSIFFSVAVFYFIALLLGESAIQYLEPYGGDYFAFVLIGIAFSGYFGVGLSSFSSSLRQAQTTGTLEAMLTTPTSLSTIIFSSSLWSYLMTTFRVFVYLAVGVGLLGVKLIMGNFAVLLLILVLTIISFSSLGIIAASFIMVLKRGDPVTWLFNATSSLLGGIYYPVSILPVWLQLFAYLLPITYALRAMRLALLQGAAFSDLLGDILALVAFSLVLLPLSILAFHKAVQRAKEDGSLTHY